MRHKKGFTLLELMIVITILGILAALISGQFLQSLKRGRDTRRKSDLEQVQKALELYYEDNKSYPTPAALSGQICAPAGCSTKAYMQRVPGDPDGTSYGYSSDGTYYRIYTCLENDQQILPYVSTNYSGVISCARSCKDPSGSSTTCVWGVSDTNSTP
jgi:general secretion pathway protein G